MRPLIRSLRWLARSYGKDLQQRAFAGAIAANDAENFALLHVEGYPAAPTSRRRPMKPKHQRSHGRRW